MKLTNEELAIVTKGGWAGQALPDHMKLDPNGSETFMLGEGIVKPEGWGRDRKLTVRSDQSPHLKIVR